MPSPGRIPRPLYGSRVRRGAWGPPALRCVRSLRSLRSDDQVGIGVLLVGACLEMLPSVLAFLTRQYS